MSQYFPGLFKHVHNYIRSGRIKLITFQIKHELSVTIHGINTNRKKRYIADPIYNRHVYQHNRKIEYEI